MSRHEDDMEHVTRGEKAKDRAAVKSAEKRYGKAKPDTRIRSTADFKKKARSKKKR